MAANANALAAAALSISSAAETFKDGTGAFYKLATPDTLDTTYSDAFGTDIPDTCAGLAAVTAAIVAGACISQKIADVVPGVMPKISMNSFGMTLSCGPENFIEISETGITIVCLEFEVGATSVDIDSETVMLWAAGASATVTTPEMTVSTYLEAPAIGADDVVVSGQMLAGEVITL